MADKLVVRPFPHAARSPTACCQWFITEAGKRAMLGTVSRSQAIADNMRRL